MTTARDAFALKHASRIRACLQSSGPEEDSDEVDHGCEASVGPLVACGDAAKCLDGAEEVLDEMAPFVFVCIVGGMSSGALA